MRNVFCAAMVGLLALTGCGFQPVYAPIQTPTNMGAQNVQSGLGSVYVAPLPERMGQQLRNALLDRGFTNNQSTIVLSLNGLSESEFDLGIASDNTATRRQLTLTAQLVITRDGKEITNRPVVARATYNVLISQYTTIVSKDSAERQVVNDMARQIEMHTALVLRQPAP